MERRRFLRRIDAAFKINPVVALVGPRQCGKTTLARQYIGGHKSTAGTSAYFDLERQEDLARLEHPELALAPLSGLVVIDEVQRLPKLFETLRVLADRRPRPSRFLILGSASRELLHQTSETLAGRISYLELTPLQLPEIKPGRLETLWTRGGFPPSFLAKSAERSYEWRQAYISTYLERDLPALGLQIPPATLRRFWMMLVHFHGQIFNSSEISASLSVSHHTARRYLDILNGTFMMRILTPWFENIGKRQVKQPKIFFRDSGIFHALMGVRSIAELRNHPKLGASWEGFALEEVIRARNARQEECFFWATHNRAELDLLIMKDGAKHGYEIKFTDAPRLTPSMHIALEDLSLKSLTIIYPGKSRFRLSEKVEVVPLQLLTKSLIHP